MILTPTYDGPPALRIDGPPTDQLVPLTRQRRRMQEMLGGLTDEQWAVRAETRITQLTTQSENDARRRAVF